METASDCCAQMLFHVRANGNESLLPDGMAPSPALRNNLGP